MHTRCTSHHRDKALEILRTIERNTSQQAPSGANVTDRMEATQAQASFRAITYRLTTAQPKQLPLIASQVAPKLWNYREILSSVGSSKKQENDSSSAANRFRTYLTTLLQDRTVEGRWAAVVLVKASIEASGIEGLSKSNVWVRALLGILKKPDPVSTRILATITLTRIFSLTRDFTNLVREITTPALPNFVSTCMSNAENQRCTAAELQTILDAFATLIPHHPTIFRTNETQLRSLLLRILSSASSPSEERYFSKEHRVIAAKVLVLLHHLAPNKGAPGEWEELLISTVNAAHKTCDYVFRSVNENWRSTTAVRPALNANALVRGEAEVESEDAIGLSAWHGIFAGSERAVTLLQILRAQMQMATSSTVTIRIGVVSDLLSRVLSVRVPSAGVSGSGFNPQVSKEERETLFAVLPAVHLAALQLADSMLYRFDQAAIAVSRSLFVQVRWIFHTESVDDGVRASTYNFLTTLLKLQGPSLSRDDVTDLESIIKACCTEILPTIQPSSLANGAAVAANAALGIDANKRPKEDTGLSAIPASSAANTLLPLCFSHLDQACVPARLRALLERTAILGQHKDALFASVLNPAPSGGSSKTQPSLLPLLARQYADSPEVEALLRPRMPVIMTGQKRNEGEGEGLGEEIAQYDEPVTHCSHQTAKNAEGVAESEDLCSASPLQQPTPSSTQPPPASPPTTAYAREQSHHKRTATDISLEEDPAKRLRPSLGTGSSAHAAAAAATNTYTTSAPGINAATARPPQPSSSSVTAPEPSQQTVNMPVAPVTTTDAGAVPQAPIVFDEDDGSDFEMPPLTMEQDTEDEDED